MRRKEKEITSIKEIEDIIHKTQVCRLAMAAGNEPYVVPLNFGYDSGCLYFHSASEGKKIDILKENNRVSVEFSSEMSITKADKPCKWGSTFESVIAQGRAEFVDVYEEKIAALEHIMNHYGESEKWEFGEGQVRAITIIKVTVESMTGKRSL